MTPKTMMMSLWDLLVPPPPKPKQIKKPTKPRPIQAKYDAIVEQMKNTYGFRIRKWRTSMSGCAWELTDKQGNVSRLVESPYPKGPMSCAIFLHEVGHHAIGFHVYKPRCLEEYYAWAWSLEAMQSNGVRITDGVLKRRDDSLQYALAKALRRGLKKIPDELMPFAPLHLRITV
ncbi:MAG TPA: hypothetical protein QF528_05520 [Phycisphaerales bacterium]|jgi:hypothetical protein|nr:hypothetical protein [Phycisphaerales bacterium]|tara:strand:+ start:357 stop:878 length:522 start_codon:yes stop_codon:yes gene_type:complete